MTEFEIRVRLKDVTEGDAQMVAQAIVDDHGDDLDYDRGDMTVDVLTVQGTATFATDWTPTR